MPWGPGQPGISLTVPLGHLLIWISATEEERMAWSTKQLADLAGTTVKTVRHYHRVGVLDEPERAGNGYKQYRTAHLVRLLQVKRMSDLGISLAQIRALATNSADADASIAILDAELEATIERLQRVRAELALLLRYRAPLDTPAPFANSADGLPEKYRGLLTVYSRVLNETVLHDTSVLLSEPDDASEPFEALTDESDGAVVEHVAQLLAVSMAAHRERFPWAADLRSATRTKGSLAQEALSSALLDTFNHGQLRALARADEILRRGDAEDDPPA